MQVLFFRFNGVSQLEVNLVFTREIKIGNYIQLDLKG